MACGGGVERVLASILAGIWSPGCVFYECLTGKRAFAGDLAGWCAIRIATAPTTFTRVALGAGIKQADSDTTAKTPATAARTVRSAGTIP